MGQGAEREGFERGVGEEVVGGFGGGLGDFAFALFAAFGGFGGFWAPGMFRVGVAHCAGNIPGCV